MRLSDSRIPLCSPSIAVFCRFSMLVSGILCCALLFSSCAKNDVRKSHSLSSSSDRYSAGDREASQAENGKIPATQRPYTIDNITYYPIPSANGFREHGIASWYGPNFHGRKTSNGEVYDMYSMTAAHKTLPMDTRLLVKNLDNGKQTVVRINDRGPFVDGRVIDLSFSAARTLDLVGDGTARVQIVALNENEQPQSQPQPTPVKRPEPVMEPPQMQFFIQVGSFTDKAKAIHLQNRFITSGHNSFIRTQDQNGAPAFKVLVYVGQDPEKAKLAESKLISLGYREALVVSR